MSKKNEVEKRERKEEKEKIRKEGTEIIMKYLNLTELHL